MKNYVHKANLKKLEIILNLDGYLQTIMKTISLGEYRYFFQGEIDIETLQQTLDKMDKLYLLCESSVDRSCRFNLDQPTIQIIMYNQELKSSKVKFILLARDGNRGISG
jgi:hypothetical protein